jgi:nucleoside-diphosphate-sugar epimerase
MSELTLPDTIADVGELDELLSLPTPAAIDALSRLEGDILVLGAAGKIGPTLVRMAKRAGDAAGAGRKIIAVDRFPDPAIGAALQSHGLQTIQGDLLDPAFLGTLPDAPNVVFMAGMKFGATGNEPLTWAMNVWLPAIVCRRFPRSRIAAYSTGNVYGLVPVSGPGSVESDLPNPAGEYAMSCLGRERMFQYFSSAQGTPVALVRLNYAVEMRYGVLVDLARQVWDEKIIDLSMGYANVIWQGDAAAMSLCALADAASPALILNVAGPERLRVRQVCQQFGELLGKAVRFTGTEAADALLNNGQEACRRYGAPQVSAGQMIRWIADWISRGGASLGKPTHFEVRNGKF